MNNDYMFEDEENEGYQEPEYGYTGPQYSRTKEEYRAKNDSMGLAIASMVLGILSLIFFLVGINIVASVIAIILGIIYLATSRIKKGKGMAVAGITTAALGIVCCIGAWAFIISNADHIAVLRNDVEGMQEWYEFYGLDDDYFYDYDYYDDYYDNYPGFGNPRDDESPFDNYDFDINDSL
ncbi:MAG: DUF4190 domain-containing protein [Pseudobutyrivibrio sp.]|nr:DUF4190 domain-containing protein [Pseudobutyrivibrio sp.]